MYIIFCSLNNTGSHCVAHRPIVSAVTRDDVLIEPPESASTGAICQDPLSSSSHVISQRDLRLTRKHPHLTHDNLLHQNREPGHCVKRVIYFCQTRIECIFPLDTNLDRSLVASEISSAADSAEGGHGRGWACARIEEVPLWATCDMMQTCA